MTNELPERSPVELQADDCGALITISRQWYEEAIDALRAQEKEPCEYCESGYTSTGKSLAEYVSDDEYNFCPVCGRPLKGEKDG